MASYYGPDAMHPTSSPMDYRGYSANTYSDMTSYHQAGWSQPTTALRPDHNYSGMAFSDRHQTYKPNPSAPLFQPQQSYAGSSYTRSHSHDRREHAFSGTLPSIHSYYEPAAPAYEPVAQPKPKEESAGGLVKHLDYEIQVMADFLFDSTLSIMNAVARPVSQDYREWIKHVLSATRLPSTTIYLALNYLASRVENFSSRSIFKQDIDVKRMFVVSLILASKYADDSTFINRSWAEVAKIDVQVINFLEREWLQLIEWRLDVKVNPGWEEWRTKFKQYEIRRRLQTFSKASYNLPRINTIHANLPPIQSAVTKQYAFSAHPSMPDPASVAFSCRPKQDVPYSALPVSFNPWNQPRDVSDGFSPDSAPYTGPNTPEYYTGTSGWSTHIPTDARYYNGYQGWSHPQQAMAQAAATYTQQQQYLSQGKHDEYANVWNTSTPTAHVHSNMNHCSQCPPSLAYNMSWNGQVMAG